MDGGIAALCSPPKAAPTMADSAMGVSMTRSGPKRSMTAMLGPKPPAQKMERTDFAERIAGRAGNLLVINDEAHHTHDEDLNWNDIIRQLHEKTPLTAQLDFSATPRFQKGSIFPWTISDYPLKQAILDGVVKRPVDLNSAPRSSGPINAPACEPTSHRAVPRVRQGE